MQSLKENILKFTYQISRYLLIKIYQKLRGGGVSIKYHTIIYLDSETWVYTRKHYTLGTEILVLYYRPTIQLTSLSVY